MTLLTQQLEDKKKGCGRYVNQSDLDYETETYGITYHCGNNPVSAHKGKYPNIIYCQVCRAEIAILEQAITEIKKQRQEISKSLRERIMRNGNLSNRIIENNYGEFEHKHDYILNEIVCEIIEETLQQLNQPKTEE